MPTNRFRQRDPAAALRQLQSRVQGGGSPLLDTLGADEMAAANEMISRGEAEISYHSCRQFLVARRRDDFSGLAEMFAAAKRFVRKRRAGNSA